MECKDFEPSIIQENRILRLCKRLDRFTLDEIASISEVEENTLELLLLTLVNENRLIKRNDFYLYNKIHSKAQKPMLFQYYSNEMIDLILRCFSTKTSSNVASNIVGINENSIAKFYKVFREKIYNKQKNELIKKYSESPQIARHRIFFNQEAHFYTYGNVVYVSDKVYESSKDRACTKEEVREFKRVYSFITRSLTHNKNEYYLHTKIAEAIWRKNKSFEQLYHELKLLIL